jgi:N-acetylmuramoyl-L-alanine amidase
LEAKGFTVYLTRTDDTFIAKRSRAVYCNTVSADILVSIHHNTYVDDTSVDYSTALYYKAEDKNLAGSILASVANLLGTDNRGISRFNNSLLWIANMPATLIEGYFITNKSEYNKLIRSKNELIENEALAISQGIENYFTDPDNDSFSEENSGSLHIDRVDE